MDLEGNFGGIVTMWRDDFFILQDYVRYKNCNWGLKPFRLFNLWLEDKSFKS